MFRREGFIILILAVLTMTIVSCSGPSDPVTVLNPGPTIERNSDVWTEYYCGTTTVVDLFAGQNEIMGEVKVANDGGYLYVEFVAFDPWVLVETHIAVYADFNDIPQTRTGNPKIGQFAYDIESLIELDCDWDNLIIAAHAEVEKLDEFGEAVQAETAWGGVEEFPGNSWATYFTFIVQDCLCLLPPADFQMNVAYNNAAPDSYFLTTLSNVPDGYALENTTYLGWCTDEAHTINSWTNYYPTPYSSYDPNLPTHAVDDDWDMVNYVLNHKQGNKNDIQAAIWYFVNGGTMPGSTAGQAMVADAEANGEGYVPPAGMPVAIILDLGTKIQLTIIEVDECLIDYCEI